MHALKATWEKLAGRYTDDQAIVAELWQEIGQCYTAPGRYYHNLDHLQDMIDKAFQNKEQIRDIDTFLFSVFYHDLVYDVKRKDNEEKSAEKAAERLRQLGVPENKIMTCRQQILATATHEAQENRDSRLLMDIDLAVLGSDPSAYENYAKMIRKEYAIYPSFLYKKGRKKVLRQLLEKQPLYHTQIFRKAYEEKARINMTNELNKL